MDILLENVLISNNYNTKVSPGNLLSPVSARFTCIQSPCLIDNSEIFAPFISSVQSSTVKPVVRKPDTAADSIVHATDGTI